MAELPPGTEVAGCRVDSVLGRGGMGIVYRATQLSLDRTVALKVIAPDLATDEEFRERFKHEARLAASIEHPNVIPVYEAGERDGLLYLIMRYVEGTDLGAMLKSEGALEPGRAARLVAQVAAALAAAHRRQLVHRDVKPANVLISSAGGDEHAYLTDFGIARHLAATRGLTRTGAVVGTLDYIAPERLEKPAGDARSDIYALGCVLFETLTGSVPYPRDSEPAKMFAHASAPVPSPREVREDVPEQLDDLTRRSMAKEPDERPSTAGELAEALLAFVANGPGRSREEPSDVPVPPPGPAPLTEPASTEPLLEQAATAAGATERSPADEGAEPGERAPADEGAPPTERAAPDQRGRSTDPPSAPPARPTRPAAPSSSRGRGGVPRGALLGVLAAVAVLVIGVLVFAGGSGDEGDGDGGGGKAGGKGSSGRLAPVALAPVSVGSGADGVAVGEGSVWVANKDDNRVTRIDPASRKPAGTTPVGTEPDSIAVTAGGVWVTNTGSDSVSRLDPGTGQVSETIQVGDQPEGIAADDDAVWVANKGAGTITRIAVEGGDRRTSPVGGAPIQLAIAPDAVWVTLSGDGAVARLDPDTGERASAPVRVGGAPRGIAFAEDLLWVSSPSENQIVVVDPSSRKVVHRIGVAANPREVRAGEGAIWVTNADAGEVTAIDPESRKVAGTVSVRGKPFGLGVGDGLVWAAGLDNGLLTPIRPRGR